MPPGRCSGLDVALNTPAKVDADQESPKAALRREADRLRSQLKAERREWEPTWHRISHYIVPTRARRCNTMFESEQRSKKWANIVDPTATIAHSNLAAFMMAGITSPARQWFKLSTNDDIVNDDAEAKAWLDVAQTRLERVLSSSNFYSSMQQIYEEVSAFGTGACLISEDQADVVRFYPLTVGEYFVGTDDRGEVDTLIREYRSNVAQLVRKFGIENCSESVRNLWERQIFTQPLDVVHAIIPNTLVDRRALGWQKSEWIGVYYERASSNEHVLRVEGHARKPFFCPRWSALSDESYGHGLGEQTLPDATTLQFAQLRLSEATDKIVRPPMVANNQLKESGISLLPGVINFASPGMIDSMSIRSIYEVPPQVQCLQERISLLQTQICRTLKNDLILMVSQQTTTQPVTAAEINAKQQEKLLVLGPVLERFHNEALDPIISTSLHIMERGKLLPDRPESLSTAKIKINFVSVLAQAQRATDTASIEQFTGFIGHQAALSPEVLDTVNFDEMVSEYGDLISVPANVMRTPDQTAQIRQQKAYQQQQAQAAEQAQQLAQGAKTLSDTNVGGGMNALQAITGGIG